MLGYCYFSFNYLGYLYLNFNLIYFLFLFLQCLPFLQFLIFLPSQNHQIIPFIQISHTFQDIDSSSLGSSFALHMDFNPYINQAYNQVLPFDCIMFIKASFLNTFHNFEGIPLEKSCIAILASFMCILIRNSFNRPEDKTASLEKQFIINFAVVIQIQVALN